MTEKELQAAASGLLDTAFNLGEPEKAVSEYVGDKFVQHNPQVADGAEAFIAFVHSMRSQFPEMHLDIKRVITQGEMVVTHSPYDAHTRRARAGSRRLLPFPGRQGGRALGRHPEHPRYLSQLQRHVLSMREARRYPATTGRFASRPHLGLLAAAAARLERFPGHRP
jgi:predicted SnoaL-like aldol condensation-catalyzing enzyme